MSSLLRSWVALGLLLFVGSGAVRPALAAAAADDEADAPTVAPAGGNGAAPAPAPPYPAAPYGGYPPPGYPPPGYPPAGYAPPGYAPYPGYGPPQLTQVHRPRRGLVIGGAVTFGVSWGIAASISLLCDGTCSPGVDYLWIPVGGPLVVAARERDGAPGIFYLWSAAEAAGLIMLIVGMAGHDVMEYRMVRGGPTLRLGPLLARDANGMALTARW